MPKEIPKGFLKDTGVRRDWPDMRDQDYRPNLTILPNEKWLDAALTTPAKPDFDVSAPVIEEDHLWGAGAVIEPRRPIFGVRHQGNSGRCVGYALANLIDIQRNLQRIGTPLSQDQATKDIVSADMLYRMAFFHDRYPDPNEDPDRIVEGVRTLRAAIKGFYHHGACLDWPDLTTERPDHAWQSVGINPVSPDKSHLFPSVAQAKKARETALGAYYRVDSVLNHFHAAINDAGAILCAAKAHDGWLTATPQNGGVIAWPPRQGTLDSHAFVITGFDRHGFHVLNSWGEGWGGYMGQLGIGLWRYADWAQNIVDAWVLRMGVYAPTAFGATIGRHGTKGVTGTVRAGSVPCIDLVGHYMHLDDGFHVSIGSYPSFPDDWDKTHDYLEKDLETSARARTSGATKATAAKDPYKGILIWIPGSLEGIKPAFSAAVQRKNPIKALGLYPYTIFWCNDFVEKSLEVLQTIFEGCKAQAGENAEHLDDLIELKVQGVGRAFWRDIELAARRSVRGTTELPFELDEEEMADRLPKGHVATFLASVMALKAKTGCEIHVVAEGAGALVFHEILTLIREDRDKVGERSFPYHETEDIFDSVHFIHPAIGMIRARKRIMPLFKDMNAPVKGRTKGKDASTVGITKVERSPDNPRARLYIPTHELAEKLTFGSYSNSLLQLVSRAFEDRKPPPKGSDDEDLNIARKPRAFLGMADTVHTGSKHLKGGLYCLSQVAAQTDKSGSISQTQLIEDPTITQHIFAAIEGFRKT